MLASRIPSLSPQIGQHAGSPQCPGPAWGLGARWGWQTGELSSTMFTSFLLNSQGSHFFDAWCPLFWNSLFQIVGPFFFFHCVRQEVKAGLCYSNLTWSRKKWYFNDNGNVFFYTDFYFYFYFPMLNLGLIYYIPLQYLQGLLSKWHYIFRFREWTYVISFITHSWCTQDTTLRSTIQIVFCRGGPSWSEVTKWY